MEFSLKEVLIWTFLGAVFTLFFYKTIDIYIKRKRYKHIPGPSANGILSFYLGYLRDVLSADKNDIMFTDLLHEW